MPTHEKRQAERARCMIDNTRCVDVHVRSLSSELQHVQRRDPRADLRGETLVARTDLQPAMEDEAAEARGHAAHVDVPAHAHVVGGDGGDGAAEELPSHLRLFRNATSLGGVESLVEWRRKYDDQISPLLLRMSVGLEEPEQLQADLQQSILAVS